MQIAAARLRRPGPKFVTTEPDAAPMVLEPERFVAGGETLARSADGKVVFVRGAVPGDVVTIEPVEDRSDWSRGRVTSVRDPGPDRVEPPCAAQRSGCGGCDWQHVAVPSQIGHKAEIVRDALRRTAKLPDATIVVGPSVPAAGYRTTIRVIGDPHGRAAFRADRSNRPVAFDECLVAHPLLGTILDGVRIDPDVELTLRVSVATGEATARWDTSAGSVHGLGSNVNTSRDASLVEVVGGHRFVVSAASFFQSGPAAAELLVDAVQRAAPELATAELVVDAYAGVGLFAVAATSAPTAVITIESSRSAHADSVINLSKRDSYQALAEVARWRPDHDQRVDVAIADPARTGLGKPGVAALVRANAPVLVLVSCDPVALARDAGLLAQQHYRLVSSEVLDLFPMTHHVETVSRFELQP